MKHLYFVYGTVSGKVTWSVFRGACRGEQIATVICDRSRVQAFVETDKRVIKFVQDYAQQEAVLRLYETYEAARKAEAAYEAARRDCLGVGVDLYKIELECPY